MIFDIWVFFENMSNNSRFIKIWQQYPVLYKQTNTHNFITSRSLLLRIRNFSEQIFGENQNTHFYVQQRSFQNSEVCEIIWKNNLESAEARMTIWCVRNACWIPKATNKLSEHVRLIAFPLQQWLHERTSILRYTYNVYIVIGEIQSVLCEVRLNIYVCFQ